MAKVVKQADKDTSESRKLKLHGSGSKRIYFTATERAAVITQTATQKGNRRP